MAVQAAGTLLLFALVITPAATAITLTPRPAVAMAISNGLSVASVWIGLAAGCLAGSGVGYTRRLPVR